VALAHEWGHHLQALRRVDWPRTPAQSVNYENQADCIAGVWTEVRRRPGWLEYADDLDDVSGRCERLSAAARPAATTSAATERANAFQIGYRDGLRGCNAFASSTLIV
jgi:predicted metalloprotease